MFNSLRARLTLWYVSAFGALLIGFSIFVYAVLSNDLYDRLDHSLVNAAETAASSLQTEANENHGNVVAGATEVMRELKLPEVYIAFYQGDQLLASDYPDGRQPASFESVSSSLQIDQASFKTVEGFGESGARVIQRTVQVGGQTCLLVVAAPLDDLVEQLESIRRIFYIGLPAALLVAGLGGYMLARKSLAPVMAMSNQAQHISARNLHERLRVNQADDELSRLATVFNELLSRLDHSFERMRVFMADASHELRTPLSIIRGEADVALSQDRESAEYQEALTVIQDEARHLSRLVDDLMALARADAGERPLQITEIYLNDLAEECCKGTQVLAQQKGVSLSSRLATDVPFRGDEDLLRRMMLNLIDNAIKYTPTGGAVTVELIEETDNIRLIVADTGIGIPAEAASQIFERFYRGNKARSRADGGTGLGLSIARWAAEAHQGTIRLDSQSGEGSKFTVTLPR